MTTTAAAATTPVYATTPARTIPALEWSTTLCDGECVTRSQAEATCAALGDGWRLPTLDELLLIVDHSRSAPAIDTDAFPDTRNDWYWTSTPCAWSPVHAWIVDFSYGYVSSVHRDYGDAVVRAVRSVSAPAGQ